MAKVHMTGAEYVEFDAYVLSNWPDGAELDDNAYEINGVPVEWADEDAGVEDLVLTYAKNNPASKITIVAGTINYAPDGFPDSLTTLALRWKIR